MEKKLVVGLAGFSSLQEKENNVLDQRKQLTYEDLLQLHEFVRTIPEPIKEAREEFERLATAMTALSAGRHKVIINEIHSVNPNERHFKNKRKW
ncbi:hypothetical protein [Chryseobacterium herbae]|uniref:Uncharacterized protein n=1 Tax=Chryseobacterium herbae TaxID=2976476 RepID=A0ABT2IYP5_9FLAO|nr:hypothetical protein [Chryseobacterium sp. pc1-10]MCT2563968.1 hypothetical protein [Chryseobacterium sp. pc1-10]